MQHFDCCQIKNGSSLRGYLWVKSKQFLVLNTEIYKYYLLDFCGIEKLEKLWNSEIKNILSLKSLLKSIL